MKKLLTTTAIAITLFLCGGCKTVFTSVVTITEIRHEVMNELGDELRAGRIGSDTWAKVEQFDAEYRKAASAARITLVTYKETGSGDPVKAILSVKSAVLELINLLANYKSVNNHQDNLSKATKL